MTKPILYSYWRSSCSYRVRIALAIKGMAYDYRAVHLVKDGGEQHSDAYKALNPMEQVPTLQHQGHTFTQSLAILLYLEEIAPQPSLLPGSAAQRTQILSLCEDINAGMQPIQNLSVLQFLEQQWQVGAEGKQQWGHYWIHRGFESLEKRVQATAGTFCFGDTLTLVDCLLIPQIYNALRFDVAMNAFPTLKRINETCLAMEAFIQAHPDQQPDAQ